MRIDIRNVRNWEAREGIGYQAILMLDGIRTAQFTDDGDGGPLRWQVFDQAPFTAWAASLGVSDPFSHGMVKCDTPLDLEAARLVDEHEETKRQRRRNRGR